MGYVVVSVSGVSSKPTVTKQNEREGSRDQWPTLIQSDQCDIACNVCLNTYVECSAATKNYFYIWVV